VSGHDEKDPFGETRSPEDPLDPFETFRAHREEEQAPVAPFPSPGQYTSETEATIQFDPAQVETAQFNPAPYGSAHGAYGPGFASEGASAPGFGTPPPQPDFDDYSTAAPAGRTRLHGKTRSAVVFGAVAVLAAGLGVGLYAATQSSGGNPAASPAVTTSANPANPAAGPSKGAKAGKVLTARLTVTTVGTDSFTGKTANGTAMALRIVEGTKFGTPTRPFSRPELVPGAVVYVRYRHGTNGDDIATVIAAGDANKLPAPTAATPSAGA
jgi:hypothetical protein